MRLTENIPEAAKKILSLCLEPSIPYPDKQFSYSVACEPIVYTNLLYKCLYVLELNDIGSNNAAPVLVELEKALGTTYHWLNEGYKLFCKQSGSPPVPVEIPFPYFLNSFELETNKNPEQSINIHPAYYLLAMLYLADYKEQALMSFADQDDFDNDVAPYKNSIDAGGSLLCAQISVETGGASLERALARRQQSELTGRLSELTTEKQKRVSGLTDTNQARTRLKAKALSMAKADWANDLTQQIRIGAMADHIISKLNIIVSDEENYTLLRKNIPKKDGMKKWLREIAPEYASRKGR